MTEDNYTCVMKPYIQPFEEYLAAQELQALTARRVDLEASGAIDKNFKVPADLDIEYLVNHLAYWETLQNASIRPTRQILREATATNGELLEVSAKETVLLAEDIEELPQRRRLRYGTHGLHEYRGKFFPQLVRAFLNIADIKPGSTVLDPMCGSGTTLVEAVLGGYHAVGFDLNPLSVFMARVKCACLSVNWQQLDSVLEELGQKLASGTLKRGGYLSRLSAEDREYLSRWFAERTLKQLDSVMWEVERRYDGIVRDLLHLSISNVLRRVSWQKEDDLRVRRQVLESPPSALDEVRAELSRIRAPLVRFLRQENDAKWHHGTFEVLEEDARSLCGSGTVEESSVDIVITSPPYATALPYLDTDRLSLIFLQLLSRTEHRTRERALIGHREINKALKQDYWNEFESRTRTLPQDVVSLVTRVETLNSNADVGFRRKNLGSLLARYFLDMATVFRNIRNVLRPKAPAFVVVGSNRTIAGGKEIRIDTPSLLESLASAEGLELRERVSMDMLVSRDIFRNNTTPSEEILILHRG